MPVATPLVYTQGPRLKIAPPRMLEEEASLTPHHPSGLGLGAPENTVLSKVPQRIR